MASATASSVQLDSDDAPLPSWLTNHLNIEWNSDDVDALLTSIDASQGPKTSVLPLLPSELLLHVLEHVPVDYVLDWRLVCRGFRDAIDGRILYHHVQRTRLVGYLGPKSSASMSDDEYEQLHLIRATFTSMRDVQLSSHQQTQSSPIWAKSHAVFKIDPLRWLTHKVYAEGARIPSKRSMLRQISLFESGRGYGTLVWAIELDTAVLDLDFPLASDRGSFDVSVDTKAWTVQVEWKPMLFRFLKTERALRRLMKEKRESNFTFSHAEDCLRAVRRNRLHAALDPDSKIDRHIRWSLRLLRPLWGVEGHGDHSTLDFVEADAVKILLLLRRTASLSKDQIRHLHQLAEDYEEMVEAVNLLSQSVRHLKSQLGMPQQHDLMHWGSGWDDLRMDELPFNPVAWPDDLRAKVEIRVQRWRAQRGFIKQMQALMDTSREALGVPEDAFDVTDSDF